jgi:hypothetical protein
MATLQDIITSSTTLTRSQLKPDKKLVMEIQSKLANLGFYPNGGWIDGDIGNDGRDTFTWKGLGTFCQALGLTGLPTTAIAINKAIAQKLLSTKQVDSVLKTATQSSILARLQAIQNKSPIVNGNTPGSGFVARTLAKSPFQSFVADYPTFLAQKPDGTTIISYGDSFTLSTGTVVNFSDYPDLGEKPTIDNNGLSFLSSNISHACLCIGSFSDGGSQIKAHWLGKNALNSTNLWWSTSKFIGVLNAVCQINQKSINTDVDDCVIIKSASTRYRFHDLVKDMVSYQGLSSSNAIGVLFKSFTKREVLSNWIKQLTGNNTLDFRGSYASDPLVSPAEVTDTTLRMGNPVLSSTDLGAATDTNSLAAYDLVRLISMLGWHLHLPATAKLPSAQWKSLESVVRAMGHDTARYVDVALETLGVVNVIGEPVIISKVGWGDISATSGSMTYTAFVKFVDRRFTPGKLRTFAFTLRCPTPMSSGNFDGRDTNLAVAVTEIIRRILTEELA